MLRSEHLRYRITAPTVKPRFIDPVSPALLENAAGLISLCRSALEEGMSRREWEEMSGALVRGSADVKIAAGLNKLLLDRFEFSAPEGTDYPALRRESFLRAAEVLAKPDFTGEELRRCSAAGETDLYGDLPGFEKPASFREIAPEALLHRYNLALAQGLLLYARTVRLRIREADRTELRKFLKAVKFFRLLARFLREKDGGIAVEISGPFSLFDAGNKYAVQLANLLPAAVNLPRWELTAEVRLKERDLTLKLSHRDKLVSHYRNLAAYIPEEIRLYHRAFGEKSGEWRIVGETPFLDAGGQEVIFPDLSFRSETSGKVLHVELFHRWHAGELSRRAAMLAEHPEVPLLLGIDRALLKKEETPEDFLSRHPGLRERCWFFRDFPGVTSTLNALNKAAARF